MIDLHHFQSEIESCFLTRAKQNPVSQHGPKTEMRNVHFYNKKWEGQSKETKQPSDKVLPIQSLSNKAVASLCRNDKKSL